MLFETFAIRMFAVVFLEVVQKVSKELGVAWADRFSLRPVRADHCSCTFFSNGEECEVCGEFRSVVWWELLVDLRTEPLPKMGIVELREAAWAKARSIAECEIRWTELDRADSDGHITNQATRLLEAFWIFVSRSLPKNFGKMALTLRAEQQKVTQKSLAPGWTGAHAAELYKDLCWCEHYRWCEEGLNEEQGEAIKAFWAWVRKALPVDLVLMALRVSRLDDELKKRTEQRSRERRQQQAAMSSE